MASEGKLIVVTGPSGVGKSSITREVVARSDARFSISATTRQPREGEVDGEHYWFVSRDEFERLIAQERLLEWAEVFGNYYGTLAGPVDEAITQGQRIILEIDVQGGLQVARRKPEAQFVLIVPPSDEVLAQRLRGRGSEDEQTLACRLGSARQELQTARQSGVYKHEVVNDDLECAIRQLLKIVNT
jgi:guanylate kinase